MITPLASMTMQQDSGIDMQQPHKQEALPLAKDTLWQQTLEMALQ